MDLRRMLVQQVLSPNDATVVPEDTEFLIEMLGNSVEERKDRDNLYHGVILAVRFPHLDGDICSRCREVWFDPVEGTTTSRNGQELLRGDAPLMCETVGCPKGHWSRPRGLNTKNRCAWVHFKLCEAIGRFPDDLIVARNAAIIRQAIRDAAAW